MIEHAVELAQAGHRVIWSERVAEHRTRVAEARRIDHTLSARMRGRTAALRHASGGQIDFVSGASALRGQTADAVYVIGPPTTSRNRDASHLAQIAVLGSLIAEIHVVVTETTRPRPSTLEGETP